MHSTQSEVERVLDKKKKKAGGGGDGGGGESGVFYTGMPFQQQQHGQQGQGQGRASDTEEELRKAKAQQACRVALMVQVLPTLYPSSELCKTVAVTRLAGRLVGEEGEEKKSKEGTGGASETSERKAGVVESEGDEQQRRMEVLAKYLFVYGVLTKMQRGAEHVSHVPQLHSTERVTITSLLTLTCLRVCGLCWRCCA